MVWIQLTTSQRHTCENTKQVIQDAMSVSPAHTEHAHTHNSKIHTETQKVLQKMPLKVTDTHTHTHTHTHHTNLLAQ